MTLLAAQSRSSSQLPHAEFVGRSWLAKLSGGVTRRARAIWRGRAGHDESLAVERCFAILRAHLAHLPCELHDLAQDVAKTYGQLDLALEIDSRLDPAPQHLRRSHTTSDSSSDCAALAQAAIAAYCDARRSTGDRAMTETTRRLLQMPCLRELARSPQSTHPHTDWRIESRQWQAILHWLAARRLQVQAAFAGASTGLPETICPDDGRWRAVHDWASQFALRDRLVEIGCGSGRYLTQLAKTHPHLRLLGLDASLRDERVEASSRMTPCAESQIERCAGDSLNLPLNAGQFDGAMTIETLEHALLPQHAVAELCRIVKPGGNVLIIDKNRRCQSLSHCQPWERWFEPEEVRTWLSQWCDEVTVRPIAHGPNHATGLFLCWIARRRAA